MSASTYIFATSKPWHLNAFAERRQALSGFWVVCTCPDDLPEMIERLAPRYVFFPHWSYIVAESLLSATECVCFHMTDLPYGRGGSPLQNLIESGHSETMLSALRMTSTIDGGPVYAKRKLSLAGSAREIFERSAETTLELIQWIIETNPTPRPQEGEATVFSRRIREESRLPNHPEAEKIYDHIRMLDAPGYPHAYLDYGPWRITFNSAELEIDSVVTHARFTLREAEEES